MSYYLAFTIGPIYRTINQARQTRELWTASFTFSRLMLHLMVAIRESKIGQILSPSGSLLDNPDTYHGAGLYPDRCMVALDGELSADTVRTIIDEAIRKLNKDFGGGIDEQFLKDYLLVYATQLDLSKLKDADQKNVLFELNGVLDNLELQTKFIPQEKTTLKETFFESKSISKLYEKGYRADDRSLNSEEQEKKGNSEDKEQEKVFITYKFGKRLPSLLEISLNQFKGKNESTFKQSVTNPISNRLERLIERDKNKEEAERSGQILSLRKEIERDDELEEVLLAIKQKFPEDFRLRHKYIAIVFSDGDKVGKTIASLGNDTAKIQDFSQELMNFSQKAAGQIADFGGLPVYIGGDDLLFLAPLINHQDRSLLELLNKLNNTFKEQPSLQTSGATLSFGVSITYYKYPLGEAMEKVRSLLFGQAKHYTWRGGEKNAVAFSVLKHSGQPFEATLGQSTCSFDLWTDLAKIRIGREDTLISVLYKLDVLFDLLVDAVQYNALDAFFDNHFNELVHGEQSAFLEKIKSFVHHIFWEHTNASAEEKKANLFGALRFIQFLTTNEPN